MPLSRTTLLIVSSFTLLGCSVSLDIDREINQEGRASLAGMPSNCDTEQSSTTTGPDSTVTVTVSPLLNQRCHITAHYEGVLLDVGELKAQVQDALAAEGASGEVEVTFDELQVTARQLFFADAANAAINLDTLEDFSATFFIDGKELFAAPLEVQDADNEAGLLPGEVHDGATPEVLESVNAAFAAGGVIPGSMEAAMEGPASVVETLAQTPDAALYYALTFRVLSQVDVSLSK